MARILVIEDDTVLREILCTFLEDAGYDVVQASNGMEAIEVQRESPADLIITDIFMPEKDGTEFIMDISDEFPGIKIIAISGGGDVHGVNYLDLAKNLGAAKSFQKPFTQAEILAAVEELLG